MDFKTRYQLKLLSSELSPIEKVLNNELNDTQRLLSQNENWLFNPEKWKSLRHILIMNQANNLKAEENFRKACFLYKESSISSSEITEAFQEYVRAYNQLTSLYLIRRLNKTVNLIVYNTENEIEEVKTLGTPEIDSTTCLARLPNGDLFCFGNYELSGITLIIDNNHRIRLLPSGTPCKYSSAIYYNRNVYCFGGYNHNSPLFLSSRFNIEKKRWFKLHPMPLKDYSCNSVIFNGNILISGLKNTNLLVYSVYVSSFSTIPYSFTEHIAKILISTAERLYLIECPNGLIYESGIKDEYNWDIIGNSSIKSWTAQVYSSYNKGVIYIITDIQPRYYKFDLEKRQFINF
ncbi:unnamed protein product [Blepharisma stoltei]|uniref:Uncharacterized protein n=1 Tax=Blepharisma stoltei TaxID=1481888 RepID=A0AAU9JG78_9CILI|nr:unnamed protein product [Blepharisma stoltei]